MEIIDHTQPPKEPQPIKLIGCLQATLKNGQFSFGTEANKATGMFPKWPTPYGSNKIERIFRQNIDGELYDVMIISRKDQLPCLFIGQWNDGVWVD